MASHTPCVYTLPLLPHTPAPPPLTPLQLGQVLQLVLPRILCVHTRALLPTLHTPHTFTPSPTLTPLQLGRVLKKVVPHPERPVIKHLIQDAPA